MNSTPRDDGPPPKGAPQIETLSAQEACNQLGVRAQTLYAYVSRGLIRAVRNPQDARKSRYVASDVSQYAAAQGRGRSRRAIAQTALHWGEAAIPSRISEISDGALRYRGHDAIEMAQSATLEETAELLLDRKVHWHRAPHMVAPASAGSPTARMLDVPAHWSGRYPEFAPWHAPTAPLLYQMIVSLAGNLSPSLDPAHVQLARALGVPEHADCIRTALVLCADHEMNASTFAARITASAGANLPACVLSGLATLSGTKHGGMTSRARGWMNEATERSALVGATEVPPGFGHTLYPEGDPRADALLHMCPPPPEWGRIIDEIHRTHGLRPSLDLGLATLSKALALPDFAGFAIFAVGRIAGWVAHASEQRSQGTLIRPRAYVE